MNKKEDFFEYLKTFFGAVLFVFIAVVIFVFFVRYQVYQGQTRQQEQNDKIDPYLIGVLIDKNKYLENKYPKDYRMNLKLGILYELEKDFKNSELNYKMAISKAPYNQYNPKYRLILLYLKMNRLDEAKDFTDTVEDRPDRELIEYKGDIYKKLADKYYNLGDYNSAIDEYNKSLLYFKILKEKDEIEYINNSIASAYIYLAEDYLDHMHPDEAVNCLKIALSIVNAPIIKYKLALLLINKNPNLAYQYLQEVFQKMPEIINYDVYLHFLSDLAIKATMEGNVAQADLYEYRISQLKEYFQNNILSVNDIAFEDVKGAIKNNTWRGKTNIYLEGKLKNVSKYQINSLYIGVIFKENNQVIADYTQQIVDTKSVLKPGEQTPLISIRIEDSQPKKDNKPPKINAEIYLSKTEKSCKLHLKTVEITEQTEKKYKNKFWHNIIKKIISKMPAALL